ncbi:MAG: peptidylprolyl isomerase [Desulfobulbales bacterium]|nr:peptidylprolyl isomerase [Desulfobulbales bacterium]
MYRIAVKVLLLASFFSVLLSAGPVKGAEALVVINGVEYSAQDYRDWWGIWREPGMKFFETPREYIDFHLLAEQARQMEYDQIPEYRRKVEVFLTVRALAALKQEEVDAKNQVSEEEIRAEFEKRYAPMWYVQILGYDDAAKAAAVFAEMEKHQGQKAGRLVFADFGGVNPEEGGPLFNEELQLFPEKIGNDKEFWLPILADLEEGGVSEPKFLESLDRHIIVRLDEISRPDEEFYAEKRDKVKSDLLKENRQRLSGELVERLRAKYNVKINHELVDSLNLVDDYPDEVLNKPVIEMDDLDFPAGALLANAKKEKQLRHSLTDGQLKSIVIGNFVSQKVTDKEALGRHYEKNHGGIKRVYDFYRDNTLRKFLLIDMRRNLVVSAEEIREYYENNLDKYTMPGEISYVIVQGDLDLLNAMRRAITLGGNFFNEAKKNVLNAELRTELDAIRQAEVGKQLAAIKEGETSDPFPYQNTYAMVRLLKRNQDLRLPLDRVKGEIENLLREEKFNVAKKDYLEKIRALSTIKINHDVWSKIKKEYTDEES